MASTTRLSKRDLIEMSATIYSEMIDGKTDTEIMEILRLDAETYAEVRKFMLEGHATRYRESTREHTFVEYVISQRAIIKKIDDVVSDLKDVKQMGSIVGALRLRSDIEERIITRGQEFGIFKKAAERKEIIAGVIHADMTNKQLIEAIGKQTRMFDDIIKKYGDGDFLSMPAPDSLHYGESAFTTTGEIVEDDEADLLALPPAPVRAKPEPIVHKRKKGRSGKHTGRRERSDSSAAE